SLGRLDRLAAISVRPGQRLLRPDHRRHRGRRSRPAPERARRPDRQQAPQHHRGAAGRGPGRASRDGLAGLHGVRAACLARHVGRVRFDRGPATGARPQRQRLGRHPDRSTLGAVPPLADAPRSADVQSLIPIASPGRRFRRVRVQIDARRSDRTPNAPSPRRAAISQLQPLAAFSCPLAPPARPPPAPEVPDPPPPVAPPAATAPPLPLAPPLAVTPPVPVVPPVATAPPLPGFPPPAPVEPPAPAPPVADAPPAAPVPPAPFTPPVPLVPPVPDPPVPPPSTVVAPGPSNLHQLKLKRLPPPEPVNFRNRSWTPVVLVMEHDFVVQVCAPPVPETAQVPICVPLRLSRCSSMFPPLPFEATRASKEVAPVPKSTLLTLM